VEEQLAEYTKSYPCSFNTAEESWDWRDDGLIAILKFHGKA
jgi:hypothetical protein